MRVFVRYRVDSPTGGARRGEVGWELGPGIVLVRGIEVHARFCSVLVCADGSAASSGDDDDDEALHQSCQAHTAIAGDFEAVCYAVVLTHCFRRVGSGV